jgi:hypothetical protein
MNYMAVEDYWVSYNNLYEKMDIRYGFKERGGGEWVQDFSVGCIGWVSGWVVMIIINHNNNQREE